MLCKIARNCMGLALKLERSVRPSQLRNQKNVADMTSGVKPKHDKSRDHLVRTEGSFRQDHKMSATVIDIEKLSPAVRGLKLLTSDAPKGTTFKAGQWVDMTIPGVDTVGGFSICSSPYEFETHGILEFAIKYADHPPAKWTHETCRVGSTLQLSFGGDFCYDPAVHGKKDLLLIAGGVGIVPIYSILRERHDILANRNSNQLHTPTKLLFSARTLDELLFRDNIEKICSQIKNSRCDFFITQEKSALTTSKDLGIHHGRINRYSLEEQLNSFQENPTCFICGPPNFIDSMVDHLTCLGLPLENINYEKWW